MREQGAHEADRARGVDADADLAEGIQLVDGEGAEDDGRQHRQAGRGQQHLRLARGRVAAPQHQGGPVGEEGEDGQRPQADRELRPTGARGRTSCRGSSSRSCSRSRRSPWRRQAGTSSGSRAPADRGAA